MGIWGKCHVCSSCSYSSLGIRLQRLLERGHWAGSAFGLNGCSCLSAFMLSATHTHSVVGPILAWAFLCDSPHQEKRNLHYTHMLTHLHLHPCLSLPLPCRNHSSWFRACRRERWGSAGQAAQKEGFNCSTELPER